MSDTANDLKLTNSVLSFLRAGFYGQITFHSVLSQLKSKLMSDEYLQDANKAMDRVDQWIDDLSKGLPILSMSWNKPETFEGIKAFEFLNELKRELSSLIPKLEAALQNRDLANDKEAVNLLVACIARTANVRAAFLDSLLAFFSRVGLKNETEEAKLQLEETQDFVQVTRIIFETFNSERTLEPELYEKLRKEAELTPCDFRAQIHDILVLTNCYSGEFTYDMTEFVPAEIQLWKDAQIPPIAAGYWRAYRFGPAEVIAWVESGIQTPSLAANWRRAGFTAATCKEWVNSGLPPGIARIWQQAGFDPEFSRKMLSRGITDPAVAKKLNDTGTEESTEDSWGDRSVSR